MKHQIPKIIAYAFCLQIVLLITSLAILNFTDDLNGLFALYTLIPMAALAPIITCLAIFFPYSEWKRYGSFFVGAALTINILISLVMFIRFVVLSFLLHAR